MVRSAAKNYNDVAVITSSNQYENYSRTKNSKSTLNFREKLSRIAFAETAYYDSNSRFQQNKKSFLVKKFFMVI